MRSKIASVSLIVLALASGAMALLHFTQKNLSVLFGEPALPAGQRLFEFEPSSIQGIVLESKSGPDLYEEQRGQWMLLKAGTEPDRADYRVLEALLAFSSDLTILDSFPANDSNRKAMGLSPAEALVSFKDKKRNEVSAFSIGKKGAWHRHIPAPDAYSEAQNWPSVYIQPADSSYIYLCSSPYLEDILHNGFETQRDLRPFFFPPEILAEVSITRPNGTLVLARSNPVAPWRIEKPFQVDADPDEAARLVGGLYKLNALEAKNKPAPPNEESSLQVALRFFTIDGSVHEVPVTLSLTESHNEKGKNYVGRLDDDRKNVEFLIPRHSLDPYFRENSLRIDSNNDDQVSDKERKTAALARFDKDEDGNLDETERAELQQATAGYIGIDELPLDIEQLRGASLSGIDLRQLKKMRLRTPELGGPLDISIRRSPISDEWQVEKTYQGETSRANEFTFFDVKKVLTEEKALATVSDSVQDLSQYGLDAPSLALSLELFDGTQETLFFGQVVSKTETPRFYLRRNDSRTVMEIDSDHYYKIAARPYLWRSANIWNFNIIDLSLLLIQRPEAEELALSYSDLAQTWSARLGQEDVTALLNENRANRYLENLEGLIVERWLGPDHEPARRALQNPIFTLTAFFQQPDDENASLESKTLHLAGASRSGRSPFYYGQVDGDPHYFILDLATVGKLAETLLEEE